MASSPIIGTSMPSARASSIHVRRSEALRPQGLPLVSMFLNMPVSSDGKSDSARTLKRRRSAMWSMCSISTGHWSTQAPQLVQAHRTSSSIVPAMASTLSPSCGL